MKQNPFKYGVVVTGDDFVDRDEEIEILSNELSSGKSIVLYSERRLGKTSLLLEFISRKVHGIIPVYIDLYGMTTKEELAKQIVKTLIGGRTSTDMVTKMMLEIENAKYTTAAVEDVIQAHLAGLVSDETASASGINQVGAGDRGVKDIDPNEQSGKQEKKESKDV